MVFRYDVFLEENVDLSSRLISGTESEHTEPMRRTRGVRVKQNNNLAYSSMHQNIELATTLLFTKNSRIFTYLLF